MVYRWLTSNSSFVKLQNIVGKDEIPPQGDSQTMSDTHPSATEIVRMRRRAAIAAIEAMPERSRSGVLSALSFHVPDVDVRAYLGFSASAEEPVAQIAG